MSDFKTYEFSNLPSQKLLRNYFLSSIHKFWTALTAGTCQIGGDIRVTVQDAIYFSMIKKGKREAMSVTSLRKPPTNEGVLGSFIGGRKTI